MGHGNGNGKGDFFCLKWGVEKGFGYLGGFGTEAEPILPASNGEGERVLLTNLPLGMDDAGGSCAMQKMTLVGRAVLGHKRHEPVHAWSRQEVLHPAFLGKQGKHGAIPSKQLFSESPEQQPWAETDSGKIFQDPVSAQNFKAWLTPQTPALPPWARTHCH